MVGDRPCHCGNEDCSNIHNVRFYRGMTFVQSNRDRSPLICFSHLRWNFVYQRPQHLMSRAARSRPVIFMEEPVFESNGCETQMRREDQSCGVTVVTPVMRDDMSEQEQVQSQKRLLDELLAQYDTANLALWYYTPMALRFSAHLRSRICIYDCMDELSAFNFAPTQLPKLEELLFKRADLVFVGGQSLYRAKRRRHANCHAFASSVDAHHFALARDPKTGAEPSSQLHIDRPRVGFFGVIDERMDLRIVAQLAELRPDLQFVFLGPVVKIDPAALPRRNNIHWLGAKPYALLPDYLRGWDAGFMPFALNESTRFISPTKTPEFLAAGLPVCSTAVADVVSPYGDKGLVEIAADAAEFAAKLDFLLTRDRREWLRQSDQYLAGMSWDKTWKAMELLMSSAGTHARRPHLAPEARASGASMKIATHV